MKIKILMMVGLLAGMTVQARYFSVKNEIQFTDEINKFEFALVCFLQSPESNESDAKEQRRDIKMLEKTIDATSDTDPFRNILRHEVGFIVVDAAKESVQSLLEKYAIMPDEMPQFLLFRNGKVVTDVAGLSAKLIGVDVCKADLLDFIDDYFGKALDDVLSAKADADKEDKEMQLARYAAYSGNLYRGYSPYNSWGPYSWYGYRQFYQNDGYWGNSFYIP